MGKILLNSLKWMDWRELSALTSAYTMVLQEFPPSGHTMALGLTQSLTEISSRNNSWRVKAASAKGWQPYHPQVLTVLKSGSLNLPEPSGPVIRPYRDSSTFTFTRAPRFNSTLILSPVQKLQKWILHRLGIIFVPNSLRLMMLMCAHTKRYRLHISYIFTYVRGNEQDP